jgi:hypothetical protein
LKTLEQFDFDFQPCLDRRQVRKSALEQIVELAEEAAQDITIGGRFAALEL